MTENEAYWDHCNYQEAQCTARKANTQEYEEMGKDIYLKKTYSSLISLILPSSLSKHGKC